ncbi:cation:proton antiporter [Nodularia chucula]|uniref:cation:proton antiporter domain-containing protein n=1 Tax=Nodularia chucula TaxID=3093667 RepID=UPI0039C5FB95
MELISQVLALEPTSQVLREEPIVAFAVLVVVILVIPILFERLRLPGLIGLVLSGVVLGPSGWNFFHTESPIPSLLSDIGLLYLMFVAGLEVEIKHFRRRKQRSLGFGILTFIFPLLVGTLIGEMFDLGWNGALLTGSLLASHTLVAYPILCRLGVINKNEAVTVTMGATVFTNLAAVLVLAVCLATKDTEVFRLDKLLPILMWLGVYTIIMLAGFDWAGKEFFRRCGDDQGNKLLFVLSTVFLGVVGAQFIGVDTIVGGFLAGLAVNTAVGEGPLKDKVIFVGSVIFIPIFLVNFGLMIDLPAAISSTTTLELTIAIVVGLIMSKFLAAFCTKVLYRYNREEMLTMWSLSIPQMGTTLAATFVGYQAGLLPEAVLNSVVVLMLVTTLLGLWMSNQTVGALVALAIPESPAAVCDESIETQENPPTIVVPLYNPQTQQYLMEMAALLADQSHGKIVPLAIATAAAQMDAPQLDASLRRSQRLLAKATAQSRLLGVEAEPLLRIDDAFALGISRAAREQQASLILMGWGKRTGFRARLFGNVIDNVIWSAHCPVAVTRLVDSPKKIQRILVPIENLTASPLQPLELAQMLAEANQAQVTVLHVCNSEPRRWRSHSRSSSPQIAAKRTHLTQLISPLALANPPEIQIIAHENAVQAILQAARLYDLVVLPFIRNRSHVGGLAISDMTTQLAGQLTCSIVMLGEPQDSQKKIFIPDISSPTLVV